MILSRALDVMNKNLYKVDILKKIKEVQNTFMKKILIIPLFITMKD